MAFLFRTWQFLCSILVGLRMTRSTGYWFAYGFQRIHQIRSIEVGFAQQRLHGSYPRHDLTTLFTGNASGRAWYFRSITEIDRRDRDQSYALCVLDFFQQPYTGQKSMMYSRNDRKIFPYQDLTTFLRTSRVSSHCLIR